MNLMRPYYSALLADRLATLTDEPFDVLEVDQAIQSVIESEYAGRANLANAKTWDDVEFRAALRLSIDLSDFE